MSAGGEGELQKRVALHATPKDTAYRGRGSKGRVANGDRPVGSANCRRDHHPWRHAKSPKVMKLAVGALSRWVQERAAEPTGGKCGLLVPTAIYRCTIVCMSCLFVCATTAHQDHVQDFCHLSMPRSCTSKFLGSIFLPFHFGTLAAIQCSFLEKSLYAPCARLWKGHGAFGTRPRLYMWGSRRPSKHIKQRQSTTFGRPKAQAMYRLILICL